MKKNYAISFLTLLLLTQSMFAQRQMVTGTVTEDDGTTLPGVNVSILNTNIGTITGTNGEYSIEVRSPQDTLVFTFIGYDRNETMVGRRSVINIVLYESTEILGEVLVIGYGETEKKRFTGSIASVDREQIAMNPQLNAINTIQGRAAGVLVSNDDGQPGSNETALIRGLGSFRGSSPLYVIDGIPASDLSSFNSSDIESISVLKDASATSIYGSRAAGGVILITTKKGMIGKTQFDFNAQYGFSDIENPNDFRLLNETEYLDYYREAAINAGIDPDNPASGALYLPLSGDYYNTDWFDAVTRGGQMQNYELSARGGSEKTTFFFSLGYYNEIGTVIGTYFERYSGRLNMKHIVSDKVDFEVKLFSSINNQNNEWGGGGGRSGNLSGSYSVSPLSPIYADENTPFNFIGQGFNFDLPSNAGHNPVAVAELTQNALAEFRAMPSLRINYTPLPNLKVWASASYDLTNSTRKEFMSKYYLGESEGGTSDQSWIKNMTSNYNAIIEYTHNINDDHSFKLLLGGEAFKRVGEDARAGSQTLGFDAINNFAAGQATSVGKLGYEYSGSTLLSAFFRADYSYKDKLFAHGSYRIDGSSVFGPENRWGDFYAIGIGYSLIEEDFIKNIDWISALKLKASYGITGNPNSGDFEWRNTYSPGGAYNVPGAPNPGSVINNPGNPNLKWEQSSQANFGLDIGIFKDRITGSVEYYDIRSIDLISNRPISVTSGYTDIIDNVAEIMNNGIEFEISTINISTSGFTWTTSINFTANNNKVVSLTDVADTLIVNNQIAHIKGQPAYQWFMPTYAGVDPATGRQLYYTETGETTFNYSEAEIRVQGTNPDVAPRFYGGIDNILSYKGFTLSALFYYKVGGEIYRSLYQDLMMSGGAGGSNQSADELNRWQQPGDITNVPVANANYSDPGPSSRWLEDASYIRLRNLNFSYALPNNLASKLGMSSLLFSVRGTNVLTFTKYGGLNVTTGSYEEDGDYPTPRTITFGINAKF